MLQAAFAQLLSSVTGQQDVIFGAVVSGRSADVADADSMVGLLINTVPVRANLSSATTTTELLAQLQSVHNHTLEHQHVALSDIHRTAGRERLFDTVFVYENYPSGTAASASHGDELTITGLAIRDFYHYPLAIQAAPGRELKLRVQFRTDVFDSATIDAMIERYNQILEDMTADRGRRFLTEELPAVPRSTSRTEPVPERADSGDPHRDPSTLVEQILAGIYADVLGVGHVGVGESFFDLGGDSLAALRTIATINAAFDSDLPVSTMFYAPTVARLGARLPDIGH